MKKFSYCIFIIILYVFAIISCRPSPVNIRKGPYLIYPGNNTSMTVIWQTDGTPSHSSLEWSDTKDYINKSNNLTETGNDSDEHQFKYTINGLKPGTKVYYRVNVENKTYEGSFMTAPEDNEKNLTFYAYGDTRNYPDIQDSVIGKLMENIESSPEPDRCRTFCLHVGDLVDFGMKEGGWDKEYFNRDYKNLMAFQATIPLMACVGSHETYHALPYSIDHVNGGALFKKYFPYPFYIKSGLYYSFDYGPVHVVVIDNNKEDYKEGSEQYKWVSRDLSLSKKLWNVALFHEPAWSAGGGHPNNKDMQPYDKLFKQYSVRIIVQGHNHYYARCQVENRHYITTGGGGVGLHNPDANLPALVTFDKTYNFVRFDITDKTMTFTAINNEGKVIDGPVRVDN